MATKDKQSHKDDASYSEEQGRGKGVEKP